MKQIIILLLILISSCQITLPEIKTEVINIGRWNMFENREHTIYITVIPQTFVKDTRVIIYDDYGNMFDYQEYGGLCRWESNSVYLMHFDDSIFATDNFEYDYMNRGYIVCVWID